MHPSKNDFNNNNNSVEGGGGGIFNRVDIWRETFYNLHLAPLHETKEAVSAIAARQQAMAAGRRNKSSVINHGEQPPVPTPRTTDYFNVIRQRVALWSMLCGEYSRRRRNKRIGNIRSNSNSNSNSDMNNNTKQCYSLPSRVFRFVPLVPPDMMYYPPANDNDITFSYLDDDSDGRDDMGGGNNNDDNNMDEPNNNNALFHQHHNHQHHNYLGLNNDPPPVEFACDSFSLTSPGTGGEFVILNPFSGSVEVYESILDNAISPNDDESLLEDTMLDASEGVVRKRTAGGISSRYGDSRTVAEGDVIRNRLSSKMYDTPPKQVLFSVNDYFDLDINDYFGQHTPFATSIIDDGQQRQQQRRQGGGNVTVDWVGVDSHLALKDDCKSITGNIIGSARILNMESAAGGDHRRGEGQDLACTEVLAWSNFELNADDCAYSGSGGNDVEKYRWKYVCRAAGSFYFLDICSNYGKVYATFQSGCCPFDERDAEASLFARRSNGSNDNNSRQLMDMEEESMVNEDGGPIRMTKAVYCLPLVKFDDSATTSCDSRRIGSYFPSPDACFVASYPVSSFYVDPTGKILVIGTTCGTVEIWHTGMESHSNPTSPSRLQISSVRESFMRRHRSMTMDGRYDATGRADPNSVSTEDDFDGKPNNIEFDDSVTETRDDISLLEPSTLEEEFPHKHPATKISQIYLPRHLPVQQCGFVTKQRSPEAGTTLLLWQTSTMSTEKMQDSTNEGFQITAMINVPLSAQCHPEVHFDGRRLIVFGKDHIGLIFLVYHVLSTRFDQRDFDEVNLPASNTTRASKNNKGEESGGIVRIAGERRIKFVNRIRHAGLDGLEYYDSMLLSANERFLVVNTKTGNLIGSDGVRNASEGLLVIDLQEHNC